MRETAQKITFAIDQEKLRSNPAAVNAELIEALAEKIQECSRQERAAFDAYNKNIEERRALLDAKAQEAAEQLSDLNAEKKHLSSEITNALSNADVDTAADLETELDKVTASIKTWEKKKRLANSGAIKGDPELYQAAEKAHKVKLEQDSEYLQAIRVIAGAAAEWADHYKQLAERSRRANYTGDNSRAWEKVYRHYNAEMLEAAAARAEEQEREEQERIAQERRITRFA